MTPASVSARRVALLVLLSLAGCARTPEAPKAGDPAELAFLKDNDKAMGAMMAGMAAKPTGDVDKDFAIMMIPHHQGAIDMANALLKYGRNEELKTLARNIVRNQAEEIALMRRVIGATPVIPADGAHDHHAM